MNLRYRSYQKEYLDKEDIPVNDLRKNLDELNFINKWLGGHSISVSGLKAFIKSKTELTICEIGCGGGDNIDALYCWLQKHNIKSRFIGIDSKRDCIDYAKEKSIVPNVHWVVSKYEEVLFDSKPDIIFSSLFCHHFTEEQLLFQLNWMTQNSRKGFFINDLHRHLLALLFIRWMTKLFSRSYLVKHDAPLSVTRGFKKADWRNIFINANIKRYYIAWKWAFRHLIVFKHE